MRKNSILLIGIIIILAIGVFAASQSLTSSPSGSVLNAQVKGTSSSSSSSSGGSSSSSGGSSSSSGGSSSSSGGSSSSSSSSECETDADCSFDYTCEDGSCLHRPLCDSDADCPQGQTCELEPGDPIGGVCYLSSGSSGGGS